MSKFEDIIVRACEEPTLTKALAFICLWESERIVKQAQSNTTWESCFELCIKSVMDSYGERDRLEDVVNELDLSEIAVEHHGQHGTAVAELVRLVLEEKDYQLYRLKA